MTAVLWAVLAGCGLLLLAGVGLLVPGRAKANAVGLILWPAALGGALVSAGLLVMRGPW